MNFYFTEKILINGNYPRAKTAWSYVKYGARLSTPFEHYQSKERLSWIFQSIDIFTSITILDGLQWRGHNDNFQQK